ncbi:hypothetical protein [Demequina rhizosphaerae]|uniref:hypothetical protein n=1 Tax=Demequina rhizosphaerae TaxID=1638985 RepID=UPI0012E068A7|nr:hypothetical protein [Demequina rhizosphaerae]
MESRDMEKEKVLARVLSSSSTVDYVDTRGRVPRRTRAAGAGRTDHGPYDDSCVGLDAVESGPRLWDGTRELSRDEIETGDSRYWALRVGSRHEYAFRVPGFLGPDEHGWTQRVAERIKVIDEMPPGGHRSRGADEVDFTDGPAAGAVA